VNYRGNGSSHSFLLSFPPISKQVIEIPEYGAHVFKIVPIHLNTKIATATYNLRQLKNAIREPHREASHSRQPNHQYLVSRQLGKQHKSGRLLRCLRQRFYQVKRPLYYQSLLIVLRKFRRRTRYPGSIVCHEVYQGRALILQSVPNQPWNFQKE